MVTGRSVVLFLATGEPLGGTGKKDRSEKNSTYAPVGFAAATTDSNAASARVFASGSRKSRAEW